MNTAQAQEKLTENSISWSLPFFEHHFRLPHWQSQSWGQESDGVIKDLVLLPPNSIGLRWEEEYLTWLHFDDWRGRKSSQFPFFRPRFELWKTTLGLRFEPPDNSASS